MKDDNAFVFNSDCSLKSFYMEGRNLCLDVACAIGFASGLEGLFN